MRIDNNSFDKTAPNASSSKASSYSAVANGKGALYEAGKNQDAVVMSDLVSLMSGFSLANDVDRAGRIKELAQQYRAGSYVVDTAALGEALIARAFEG
jgi:anti-sigma28 factor (negative regulator of flagellin synthesis)